ncbi:plasmalemma vesicle-associated protein [Marmota monax]|uniref:Plasmalemma vesicle-associated protein n=1 Tax=Marmota monax TaxID=9995 RepID=A0A834V1U2_MARMO|nr:plasmalemma vesicle-associated protein [Marmota monax]
MGLAMEHRGAYSRAGDSPRGCWYYLRYFFLFVSLIQFLIILGLVLFMVYGNVHLSTESNLQATERRTEVLYSQVVGLSAAQVNLSKELNITARTKDNIMQMLLSARRELERINASFRQCHSERAIYFNNLKYMAAIILSEQECQEQLKQANKSCNGEPGLGRGLLGLGSSRADRVPSAAPSALLYVWDQKAKALEMELAKEKVVCAQDKDGLVASKRMAEEQLAACSQVREQQQQERQLAQDRLQKVQALCLPLDKDKFETDLRNLWKDSIVSRSLETLSYNMGYPMISHPDVVSIRRACDQMPIIMSAKVEELARSLRAGIERVARENSDLQRQKLEAEQSLRASREAKEQVEKEARAREAKLQAGCTQQVQLALGEKAVLQRERDNLAKELAEKKQEVEQLKMQVDVRISALDTCLKAKSQSIPLPRPVGPVPQPQPQPIDPASLEEFKKRILESQRSPAGNPAVLSSG